MNQLKAIETLYADCRFRSRLEARWAIVFDTLNVPWEYEREGFKLKSGKYLPDFWLPKHKCWIEIKGEKPTERQSSLAAQLAEATDKPVFIFSGSIHVPYSSVEPMRADAHYPGWGDQDYSWCECSKCGAVGICFDGRSDRLPCKENFMNAVARRDGTALPFPDDTGCRRSGGNFDKGYNWSSEKLIVAFSVARGARFEHGEQP